ncbi:MAG: DUF262 domain-containing protein [Phycisphaeraceae bacterium]
MSRKLITKFYTKPLSHFITLQSQGLLNLNPPFQRKSVWNDKDRRKLIESMLEGYPFPSIFVYRRKDISGRTIFDVLDGKQRLEASFAFCGVRPFGRQRFSVPFQFRGVPQPDEKVYWWTWTDLKRWRRHHRIAEYKLQVVEAQGELDAIRELFVRINSTGKKLSSQEQRHARFVTSPILAEAEMLARKLKQPLLSDRIVSPTQISRMKDVELMSECIISFCKGASINKKAAVDEAMSGGSYNLNTVRKAVREIRRIYKLMRCILPAIRETRFKNVSEFYSLLMALRQLDEEGRELSDRHGQRIAERLLRRLSTDASRAQEDRRVLKGKISIKPVVRDYLMAVEQGADAVGQRRKRQAILVSLIGNLFSERDRLRIFTPQQRELVWSASSSRSCPGKWQGDVCGMRLSWSNFQVDHIRPWSKGGKTDLFNARVLCRRCNAAKGNRAQG